VVTISATTSASISTVEWRIWRSSTHTIWSVHSGYRVSTHQTVSSHPDSRLVVSRPRQRLASSRTSDVYERTQDVSRLIQRSTAGHQSDGAPERASAVPHVARRRLAQSCVRCDGVASTGKNPVSRHCRDTRSKVCAQSTKQRICGNCEKTLGEAGVSRRELLPGFSYNCRALQSASRSGTRGRFADTTKF